jgi:hypothetical protein
MNVKLVGVSQGYEFGKGQSVMSYLDFEREDGRTFRVQVPDEVFAEVMEKAFMDTLSEPEGPEVLQEQKEDIALEEEEATIFGEEDGDVPDTYVPSRHQSSPESEDEVPSL